MGRLSGLSFAVYWLPAPLGTVRLPGDRGRYVIVRYQVDGTSAHKVGVVTYGGDVSV